jgi:hypothetical protein
MLHSNGTGVLVNKSTASASIAIFPNDLIETGKDTVARVEMTGSTANINLETMVQFESDELVLDHGGVSVNTTRGLRVRVGCLTVTPANSSDWTQYDVVDIDGKVTVHALKRDVYIDGRSTNPREVKKSSRSTRDLIRENEQKSREEKCGGAYLTLAENRAGLGAIMNSLPARISAEPRWLLFCVSDYVVTTTQSVLISPSSITPSPPPSPDFADGRRRIPCPQPRGTRTTEEG